MVNPLGHCIPTGCITNMSTFFHKFYDILIKHINDYVVTLTEKIVL